MFSVVFMFLRFVFEGTGLLSSPRRRESNPVPNETHSSLLFALAGGGAGSNAVTRIISWREIARSNQKRGKQADEHGGNQRRMDEQHLAIDISHQIPLIERHEFNHTSVRFTITQSRHT